MQEPTKADLAAAVAKLTEENAQMRGLLAAVSECARSVPQEAGYHRQAELSRATSALIAISVITNPHGTWAWSWGTGQGAEHLREFAAEPPGYEVYAEPAPAKDEPCNPDAAGVLAAAIAAGTPVTVTP